jgi:hypothetical protein
VNSVSTEGVTTREDIVGAYTTTVPPLLTPPTAATIVAEPGARPITNPDAVTSATLGSELVHVG